MGTAGWVFLVIALVAIAAFAVVLVLYIKRPAPDEQMLKAIDQATQAKQRANVAEQNYRTKTEAVTREIDAIRRNPNERQRLTQLAQLANRLRGQGT